MIKVQLIDVGKNKVNEVVEVKNEQQLNKVIGQHLISKHWDLEETGEVNVWKVMTGWRMAGKVKILESDI